MTSMDWCCAKIDFELGDINVASKLGDINVESKLLGPGR